MVTTTVEIVAATELTPEEEQEKLRLERQIEKGLNSFYTIGCGNRSCIVLATVLLKTIAWSALPTKSPASIN